MFLKATHFSPAQPSKVVLALGCCLLLWNCAATPSGANLSREEEERQAAKDLPPAATQDWPKVARTDADKPDTSPAANADAKPAKQPAITARGDHPVTDKWALIVGIGKFQQRCIPQLRFAAKDAQDFRDFLVSKGNFKPDHVRLLLDEKATRKQILSGFDKFLGRVARKDDLVVVYFSTHGTPESSDARGKSYLVSYDADKDDLFASAIPMSDITDLIKSRINSERVLLVMDTCFSGHSAGSKGVDEVGNMDAAKLAQGSGQLVICSSSPNEKSWESRRYQNGIFTKKLMDALAAKGAKTKLGDAFASIKDEVENEVREDQGITQRPVLATSSWQGEDLMLTAPPAAPREVPDAVKALLDPDSSDPSAAPQPNYDRSTDSPIAAPHSVTQPATAAGQSTAAKTPKPCGPKTTQKPAAKKTQQVKTTATSEPAPKHAPPAAPMWNRD